MYSYRQAWYWNGCSGFPFLRQLSLDTRDGQSVTNGFMSSNYRSLCVMTIRTIMTSSMTLSFAFLVLSFVIWLFMCTCRLQIWHLSRQILLQRFESDVKEDWDEGVCCHVRGVHKSHHFDLANLFSVHITGGEMVLVILRWLQLPSVTQRHLFFGQVTHLMMIAFIITLREIMY